MGLPRLPRPPRPPRPAAALALIAAGLLAALGFTGCASTIEPFYGVDADRLHGKRVLVLRSGALSPTPEGVHARVVERVNQALAASPDVGDVMTAEAFQSLTDLPLEAVDAYSQFSNTLAQAGVADPQLARRLSDALPVDVYALAQPGFFPCPACEEGDSLWVVGQLLDARTGQLLFRAHAQAPAPDSTEPGLTALADELTGIYLDAMAGAFRLRYHRTRFNNLKPAG